MSLTTPSARFALALVLLWWPSRRGGASPGPAEHRHTTAEMRRQLPHRLPADLVLTSCSSAHLSVPSPHP